MNKTGPIQQWIGPFRIINTMLRRSLILCLLFTLLTTLAGCAGGNDPVNEGKEKPVPAKKDK
jgi:hypothetical protein